MHVCEQWNSVYCLVSSATIQKAMVPIAQFNNSREAQRAWYNLYMDLILIAEVEEQT